MDNKRNEEKREINNHGELLTVIGEEVNKPKPKLAFMDFMAIKFSLKKLSLCHKIGF